VQVRRAFIWTIAAGVYSVLSLALAPFRRYKRLVLLFLSQPQLGDAMTLCPIALMATCNKCLAVSVCPLKTIIGDYKPDENAGKETKVAPSDKPHS